MKGKLKDLMFGREGEQILTLTTKADCRELFEELKEVDIDFEIKKYRKKRSLDANAYAWVLMDKIAKKLSISKTEVYRESIRDIGGVSQIVCVQDEAVDKLRQGWERHGLGWQTDTMPSKIEGCTNVVLYYGSSMYDTKQMSVLVDKIVQDAKDLGIQTDTPEQIERYKSEWS